jgi:NAD(P)H-nitrite reductase large subunit
MTTAEVRQHTDASGGCGFCSVRIDEILAALPAAAGAPPPAMLQAAE